MSANGRTPKAFKRGCDTRDIHPRELACRRPAHSAVAALGADEHATAQRTGTFSEMELST